MDYNSVTFQSPRPCGARRTPVLGARAAPFISIPAPLWGATTDRFARFIGTIDISIPAPLWGATPLRGGEPIVFSISIPAPLWGATGNHRRPLDADSNFNPRAPVGRDIHRFRGQLTVATFQSPRPCGARHVGGDVVESPEVFQSPRPCGARRIYNWRPCKCASISIPAPLWGATGGAGQSGGGPRISIPAPLWGATPVKSIAGASGRISIPAPLWGATRQNRTARDTRSYFNPRAPVGRDVRSVSTIFRAISISIPAPLWGATNGARWERYRVSFQSPRPCGARRSVRAGDRKNRNFNPRAPVGRDES